MQQAAARSAVVAGAEGEAGLDLDADVVRLHLVAVVRAMHEEAPGAHRREAGERIGDPILLLGDSELDDCRRLLARRRGDEFAQALFIRLEAEIDLHRPGLAAARPGRLGLEGGRRRFRGLETLDDEVGDGAGARLVDRQPHQMRRVVGRQAFEHGGLFLSIFFSAVTLQAGKVAGHATADVAAEVSNRLQMPGSESPLPPPPISAIRPSIARKFLYKPPTRAP